MAVRAHRLAAFLAIACAAAGAAAACSSGSSSTPGEAADAASERRGAGDDAASGGDDASTGLTGPALLSQTDLYSDFASRTIDPALVAYAPRYAFWADGAEKTRWLRLPPGTKIDTSKMDDWVFPVGTEVFKEFRVGGKLVETRLLQKQKDAVGSSGWFEVAYVWKDDGSDAVATFDGTPDAGGTGHLVPKQTDCFNCHDNVSDVLIGVSAIQLSGTSYTSDAGDAAPPSALMKLAQEGKLTNPPAGDFAVPGTGNVQAALGYLHANCGHCHNDEAVRLSTQTPMRLRLLVSQTSPEQTGAYTTTRNVTMKHPLEDASVTQILVPGAPDQSGMYVRMGLRNYYAMPPAGTQVVDDVGRATIHDWIASLPP